MISPLPQCAPVSWVGVPWEPQCRAASRASQRPPRQSQAGIEWLCLNLSDINFVGLAVFALIKSGIGVSLGGESWAGDADGDIPVPGQRGSAPGSQQVGEQ